MFSFWHSYITPMNIFLQSFLRNYLIKDYEIFNNFVFSLKVLQPLMATSGGMRSLLTSCYIFCCKIPLLSLLLCLKRIYLSVEEIICFPHSSVSNVSTFLLQKSSAVLSQTYFLICIVSTSLISLKRINLSIAAVLRFSHILPKMYLSFCSESLLFPTLFWL